MAILGKTDKEKRKDTIVNIRNKELDTNDPRFGKIYSLSNTYTRHPSFPTTDF